MGSYLKKRAELHKVTHEFSGKNHFFKVESGSGETYNVSFQVSCDCRYFAVQGASNNSICSHVLAVLNAVISCGTVTVDHEGLKASKIRDCLNLVKPSNRKLNEVRISSSESVIHQDKKKEICEELKENNIDFITEAMFITGGRADILVLEDFTAIEIVHSESDESIEKKKESYPSGVKIEVVKC